MKIKKIRGYLKPTISAMNSQAEPKKSHSPLSNLCAAILGIMCITMSQAAVTDQGTASKIGDLSIYQPASSSRTNLMMMIDTSGSMGISSLVLPKTNAFGSPGDVDSSLCERVEVNEYDKTKAFKNFYEWAYNLKDPLTNKTSIKKSVVIGSETITYYVRGCTKNGVTELDRLSRLKDALIPLLASDQINDQVYMGLGHFSSKAEYQQGNQKKKVTIGTATLVDGHSGRILVPSKPLNIEQRKKIANALAEFKSLDTTTNEEGEKDPNLKLSSTTYPDVTKSSSGTPTAHAYAEAGAYMMGTGTGVDASLNNITKVAVIYDGYIVKQKNLISDDQVYFVCAEAAKSSNAPIIAGAAVVQCSENWPAYGT